MIYFVKIYSRKYICVKLYLSRYIYGFKGNSIRIGFECIPILPYTNLFDNLISFLFRPNQHITSLYYSPIGIYSSFMIFYYFFKVGFFMSTTEIIIKREN